MPFITRQIRFALDIKYWTPNKVSSRRMSAHVENVKPCCIKANRVVVIQKRKRRRQKKPISKDKTVEDFKDNPPHAYISVVTYDTKSTKFSFYHPDEVQFWALVDSTEWMTTIRVGKGYLQKRLIFALHELGKSGLLMQFATAQTYRNCELHPKFGGKWIPDHRLPRLISDNVS